MDKKRKYRKSYVVAAAVVIAAVTFGLSIHPGSTTLAAAVEGYISGVSGTSYEIAWQTENEAEVIIYLEIMENSLTQKVPINNLFLQKDGAGNWGVAEPERQPEWETRAINTINKYIGENVLEGDTFKGEPYGAYDVTSIYSEDNIATVEGFILCGTSPDYIKTEWVAKINLNTYQVVEFYEITE